MDPPRTLLDYAQESGRAGKDKLKNKALMVVGWARGDYEEKREDVKLVQRLLGSRGECWRAVLEEYLDGSEKQEYQEKEERCDQCAEEVEEVKKGLKEVEEVK